MEDLASWIEVKNIIGFGDMDPDVMKILYGK